MDWNVINQWHIMVANREKIDKMSMFPWEYVLDNVEKYNMILFLHPTLDLVH